MLCRSTLYGCFFTFAVLSAELVEDKWPQFRGPSGLGIGNDKASLPSEFGATKALLSKTELPLGHGSPCIWGDRIFVTAFNADTKNLEVIAVNRKDGKIAWRQTNTVQRIGDSPRNQQPSDLDAGYGRGIYLRVQRLIRDGRVRLEGKGCLGIPNGGFQVALRKRHFSRARRRSRRHHTRLSTRSFNDGDSEERWKTRVEVGSREVDPRWTEDGALDTGHLERPDRAQPTRRAVGLCDQRRKEIVVVPDSIVRHINYLQRR